MIYDAAVVGAGAAGLMAAIAARGKGVSVLLLDSREKIGAKILMSGGTRCNVTNQVVTERDFETSQPNIMKAVLASYSAPKALEFFASLGVECVMEPTGKYFPVTNSGRTVLEALLRECERLGVAFATGKKISGIEKSGEGFILKTQHESFMAHTAILCTGGLSYPATGSDGSGYELAKSLGHSIIETTPALTPLKSADRDWAGLSGISLPVRLWIKQGNRKTVFQDDFLFTHQGFSGPAALDISRYWLRAEQKPAKIFACFLPAQNEEEFRDRIQKKAAEKPMRPLKNYLTEWLSERFVETVLHKCRAPKGVILNQVTRELRETLIRHLFVYELPVTDTLGYAKAEVTAGGIDLQEVNKSTLESKKQKGLFFAGEILDVDGRIGGFNFQWAWASGRLAGLSAAAATTVSS